MLPEYIREIKNGNKDWIWKNKKWNVRIQWFNSIIHIKAKIIKVKIKVQHRSQKNII